MGQHKTHGCSEHQPPPFLEDENIFQTSAPLVPIISKLRTVPTEPIFELHLFELFDFFASVVAQTAGRSRQGQTAGWLAGMLAWPSYHPERRKLLSKVDALEAC
jgi:hypothetical protein